LLGIILPYLVGRWWYGTQKITKDGVLVNSAGKLVREVDDEMTEGDVITAISGGEEYESVVGNDQVKSHVAKIEQRILADGQFSTYAGGLGALDKKNLLDMDDPARRKVLALLWAYLGRVDLSDEILNKGLYCSNIAIALTQSRKICNPSNSMASQRRPQHHVACLFQYKTSSIDSECLSEPNPSHPPWRSTAATTAVLHSSCSSVYRGCKCKGTSYRTRVLGSAGR
jgi:translocation protein SEC63